MEPKRFRISQDGQEYAMAIKLLGERIKLECVDASVPGAPIYCRTYTVDELANESRFFQMVPRSNEAQIELMNVVLSEKIRLYNRGDYMEVTFFLPNGEDLMVQLPRESLKLPMINQNMGQSVQQSVVYDPVTGTSSIQTSVVPGVKRSLYDEIRQRPGFGTPFVDSYGDEGFFETGLPSRFGSVGMVNSSMGGNVPLVNSLGQSGALAGSGIGGVPLASSGIGGVPLAGSGIGGVPLAGSGIGGVPLAASGIGGVPLANSGIGNAALANSGIGANPSIGASGINNFL